MGKGSRTMSSVGRLSRVPISEGPLLEVPLYCDKYAFFYSVQWHANQSYKHYIPGSIVKLVLSDHVGQKKVKSGLLMRAKINVTTAVGT